MLWNFPCWAMYSVCSYWNWHRRQYPSTMTYERTNYSSARKYMTNWNYPRSLTNLIGYRRGSPPHWSSPFHHEKARIPLTPKLLTNWLDSYFIWSNSVDTKKRIENWSRSLADAWRAYNTTHRKHFRLSLGRTTSILILERYHPRNTEDHDALECILNFAEATG